MMMKIDDGSKDGDPKTHDPSSCRGDNDVAEVPGTLFEEKGQINDKLDEESTGQKVNYSEDPFDIYPLFNKKKDTTETNKNLEHSLKYPPGFTPNADSDAFRMNVEDDRNNNCDYSQECNVEEENNGSKGNCVNTGSKTDVAESVCSGHFKKLEAPRSGGSILNLMEELVKVGQPMGYNMDGYVNNMTEIIESQGAAEVNFLALKETKMENMEIFSVKMCWGNFAFDYVHSDSVGVWLKTGNDLLIVAVYAPHDLKDKRMLWDYLVYEITKWHGEVVIMGDFNEVRYKSDRFGSVFNVQGANVFNSFIANAGLEEVPLGGSAFTWCHKSATKMSKLDRFLISEKLLISCPNITAITLERYLSDHRPILLLESQFGYGPTPFRFFHYWLDMEGFNKIVEDAWSEAPYDDSNAMIIMMKKLKYLKLKIREWNKGNMKNMKNVKAKHKRDLEALETTIDKGEGTDEVVNARIEVVKSLQNIDKLQALEMAQKAKLQWSIEGDENSRFYHGVLNKKWSQLNIRGIMVDGIWTESPNMVKSEFFHHFRSRFDKPADSRVQINMRYPNTISLDQQAVLELNVSKEELKRAVWDSGTDKSPGPDGFTFGFYHRFWKIIESDVFKAVKQFFTYGDIPKGCNSCFIALILKIPDANLVKDFRPISLIGSLYKIIAKLLANCLISVLGDIVNELKKKQSLIFKVDFEKAYDSVRWDFLDEVLRKFGFGDKWCNWIQSCLRSSIGSIIINGSPTEEFQFFKGLKQGDPLSPFLFILIMESLHLSFQRVVDAGTQVGGSMSRIQAWNEVVDKVKDRLSKWKMKALSIRGRLTLLKSVLGSMPIFHMSIFRVPLGVLRMFESIQWGLGVSSLYALNRGLMCKWIWRFYTQNTSLWARVIKAIHGDDGKVGKVVHTGRKSCWMNIVHEINILKNQGINLFDSMSVKLGNGNKIVFWEDKWVGDSSFRRKPRGGVEQDQYDALSDQAIDDKSLSEVATNTRWIKYVPIKVNVHAWKVKMDSLPTRFNLSRRGIDIESIMCSICSKGVESSSHLFFSCSMVRLLARKITHW
ncbi:RNA-directed DNA polymerase, eukaryota [Tanacetum coccineum]